MAPRPGWDCCITCRRAGRTAPEPAAAPRFCPTCGVEFAPDRGNQTYCTPEHRKRGPDLRDRSSSKRERYGPAHQKLRSWWAVELFRRGSVPCHSIACLFPGQPIRNGDKWDLGHTVDGTGWTGPEHPKCNHTEGARRGGKLRRR
jgi:hypothetical protein